MDRSRSRSCLVLRLFSNSLFDNAILMVVGCIVVAAKDTDYVERMQVKTDQCRVKGDPWRFDCFPQGQASQAQCEKRGCCWKPADKPLPPSPSGLAVPLCYYPTSHISYLVTDSQELPDGGQINATLKKTSPYPEDVTNVVTDIMYLTKSILRIRIRDADKERWEPPLVPDSKHGPDFASPAGQYDYSVKLATKNQPFGFRVSRSSGEILMETTGAFIYSNQLLQLSSILPSSLLYGLGEHRQRLLVNSSWTQITMWNKDHIPQENTDLYGSHPFYLCKDSKGWHGVFLHNSNAMDVIVQPAPAITWRTIGGILDFYIFTGPTLKAVVSQYTALIGHTFMPPYWALGFHLCWQSYGTANNTLATMDRLRYYGIPQDTQWNDIDYAAGSRVYTTDTKHFGDQAGLVREIHARGMHYIIMVDCGISDTAKKGTYEPYDLGLQMDLFINGSDGKPLQGRVWPGTTVWPDFLQSASQVYWTKIGKDFHNKVPFDGMWVDMNEISNFVNGSMKGCDPNSTLDEPPYLPAVGGKLYMHTICPSAKHQISSHYNVHNLYGFFETYRSYIALKNIRGKRPFVISRATFPGQGHFGGHWTGDNKASFYDMYKSISALLHANLYGISVSGSDICGFHGNTTAELCTRWHQLGAFYIFSRNHNSDDCHAQDPGQFGPESAASSRKVLLTRYSLLPYLYALMYRSHVFGETVARALLFEYPDDPHTHNLDSQFLWGPALMISPVLQESERHVIVYFPQDHWYNFYTGEKLNTTGQYVQLEAPLDVINLHVRGGHILPMQKPSLSTTLSRKLPFWLLVALGDEQTAEGELYLDGGDSLNTYEQGLYTLIHFTASKSGLVSSIKYLSYTAEPMILGNVTVFGLSYKPPSVLVNGISVPFSYSQDKVLYIPQISAHLIKPFQISWE